MKTKFFRVSCDYDLNTRRYSACDLAGYEFYIQCKIDELPKKLHKIIINLVKKFKQTWKDPKSLEISFGEAEPGKPDYEYIEVRTIGKRWKPQILQVFEETLYS